MSKRSAVTISSSALESAEGRQENHGPGTGGENRGLRNITQLKNKKMSSKCSPPTGGGWT